MAATTAAAAATAAAATTAAAAAAQGATSAVPPTYAVRCVGWCSADNFGHLHDLLRGMSVRHSRHDENEYGMTAPVQSNSKQTRFRMIKAVTTSSNTLIPLGPSPPVIWRVLHESPPLTGATYRPLPAQVMEVNESSLYGIFCVQAFCQMGCTVLYRILRKNYTYACIQDGLELTVSVFNVYQRDGASNTPLFPGHAVEVRALVPQGQQVEAARKVGLFCKKLLPHVLMKKG